MRYVRARLANGFATGLTDAIEQYGLASKDATLGLR